jgi:osmotically-inducible protein OsmY
MAMRNLRKTDPMMVNLTRLRNKKSNPVRNATHKDFIRMKTSYHINKNGIRKNYTSYYSYVGDRGAVTGCILVGIFPTKELAKECLRRVRAYKYEYAKKYNYEISQSCVLAYGVDRAQTEMEVKRDAMTQSELIKATDDAVALEGGDTT